MKHFVRLLLVVLLLALSTRPTVGMRGGSSVTSPATYPFQVSIQIWPGNINNCGGTILDANYILTAASCVYGWFEFDLRVGVGSNALSQGTLYEIDSYKVHKSYNVLTHANDIAVIKTKQPITIVPNSATPVTLGSIDPAVNTAATVIGWGSPDDPGNFHDALQQLPTSVQDRNNCDPDGFVDTVSSKQICSLANAADEGACRGDYGGPLLVAGVQVGIMSFFKTTIYEPECGNGLPMVYTSVPAYTDWIAQNRNF